MGDRNQTIFQKLSTAFGMGSPKTTAPSDPRTFTEPKKATYNYNSPISDKKFILKTDNEAEYQKEKLERQQQLYLIDQWSKVESELYQQAIYYETTRVASYYDFEAMEYTPEISTALDIFSEETTTPGDYGKTLNVYSESKRIKNVLENLFYNILDIPTNLPSWTRNTCKFGDNFIYLKVDREKGIVGCNQLPNVEIERKEFHPESVANNDIEQNKKVGVQFHWKNKSATYQSWEIAHFRLLGDDRRLPYGTSILEKARRIWKQLLLAEDAMLVYRTTRAPERRVFKVFVGNMNDQDVEAYVQQVANKFKRSPIVDKTTGQVDTRYNQLAVDQDFFIPVRDPNTPNPIDTLPGAQNLAEIADVEYIQKKLFAALRTPKAFIGFEETTGDGKNLALQDIRFARTVNRIQQAMIQELNKIAIIHLFILGFEDEIDNFTLTLNNPSRQADMMRIEAMKEKAMLYKDLVGDAGNGFGIMSMTRAKKEVFGDSEDEIKLDLEQQRLEKAAAIEFDKTGDVITHTGIFDNVDRLFGKSVEAIKASEEKPADEEGDSGGEDFGGSGGSLSGGFGGEDFGGEDFGGEDFGGEEPEELAEAKKIKNKPMLLENRISIDLRNTLDDLDKLIDNSDTLKE